MKQRPNRILPEVLVCGLVICIIALIAIPVYIDAKAPADRTACLNNINQLSQAIRMYMDDYDHQLPPGPSWQDAVMTYVSDTPDWNAYYCPSRDDGERGWSYGMNGCVAGLFDAELTAPTDTVLLAEVRNSSREVWWANDIRFVKWWRNRNPYPCHIKRRQANFSFCDGHIISRDPLRLTERNWLPPKE